MVIHHSTLRERWAAVFAWEQSDKNMRQATVLFKKLCPNTELKIVPEFIKRTVERVEAGDTELILWKMETPGLTDAQAREVASILARGYTLQTKKVYFGTVEEACKLDPTLHAMQRAAGVTTEMLWYQAHRADPKLSKTKIYDEMLKHTLKKTAANKIAKRPAVKKEKVVKKAHA